MQFQLGAMTVGDILDRGLKILAARFGAFFALSVIFLSPLLVLDLAMPPGGGDESAQALLSIFLALVLGPLSSAAALHVISQEFAGQPAGVADAVGVALARFFSLLGTSLLFVLVLVVAFLVVFMPGFVLAVAAGEPFVALVLLGLTVLAGLALLLVLAAWFCFFSQVVVVEGIGGPGALARSRSLGEGYRGRIVAVLLLFFVIQLLAGVFAAVLNGVLPGTEVRFEQAGGRFQITTVLLDYNRYAANAVVMFLVTTVVRSYLSVCLTLLYFDLRIRKEGFDLELAARRLAGTEALPEAQGAGADEPRPW